MEGADDLGLRGAVLDGQFRVDAAAPHAPAAPVVPYAAHDVARNLPVVVKILRPVPGLSPDAVVDLCERLRLDGAAAYHLSNDTPHVRKVLSASHLSLPAFAQAGPTPYRVVEQVRGTTLHEHLATAGPQDAATALALLEPIFLGLQAAEARRYVHGSVSPISVLLEPTPAGSTVTGSPGPSSLAKLDDGGLVVTVSRFLWDHWGRGPLEGRTFDPLFAAPEYFRDGQTTFSSGTDLYGLALTFLSVLLGRPPRMATTTRALAEVPYTPDALTAQGLVVDSSLLTVLCHGLAPDETQRPESIASFWDALRRAVALAQSTGGFTKKGTKVLPLDEVPAPRAGTVQMPKREAPAVIVESVTAAGAKKDPFKIDPFAQTFGADAARPGVSPLASTVPPGKGPSAHELNAALAEHMQGSGLQIVGAPAASPSALPPASPSAVVGAQPQHAHAHAVPAAIVGAGYPGSPIDPRSPQQPPSLESGPSGGPAVALSAASPEAGFDGAEDAEGTPVWVWIILPVAGLAILGLLGFIVALLFGWDPRLL